MLPLFMAALCVSHLNISEYLPTSHYDQPALYLYKTCLFVAACDVVSLFWAPTPNRIPRRLAYSLSLAGGSDSTLTLGAAGFTRFTYLIERMPRNARTSVAKRAALDAKRFSYEDQPQ